MVRLRHSTHFIRLTRSSSLRLVLSIVVTVMSSEICARGILREEEKEHKEAAKEETIGKRPP